MLLGLLSVLTIFSIGTLLVTKEPEWMKTLKNISLKFIRSVEIKIQKSDLHPDKLSNKEEETRIPRKTSRRRRQKTCCPYC